MQQSGAPHCLDHAAVALTRGVDLHDAAKVNNGSYGHIDH